MYGDPTLIIIIIFDRIKTQAPNSIRSVVVVVVAVLSSALRKPTPAPEVAKLNSKDDLTPLVRYLRVFPPPVTPEARMAFISQLEQRIEDARADEEGLAGLTGIPANRPYHKLCEIDLARTLTDPAIKSNTKLSMLFM